MSMETTVAPPERERTGHLSEVEHSPGVASPARRQLLGIATAMCGVSIAGAIFGGTPARADLVKTLGNFLYLDPIVLNFAFEMEELECRFFGRLKTERGYIHLSEREREVLSTIAGQDAEHSEKLNDLRVQLAYTSGPGRHESSNAESSRRPREFNFPAMDTREHLMRTAIDIKETVLFGYHGAVGLLHEKEILSCAASIAGVEGQHAAAMRQLFGLDFVTAPFEGALTAQLTGQKLSHYGFRGGATE